MQKNTPDSTVSGNAVSPPLGSDLSLATPNATVSRTARSPPLVSDLSLATPNSLVRSNPATSSPMGKYLSLAPPNETVSGNAVSPPFGSDLSLAPPNATVSLDSPPQSQIPLPPLDLPLTQTPEFISKIESLLKQGDTKQKSLNFPIATIIIGEWSRVFTYQDSLVAKCYFGKKQLIWEIMDYEKIPVLKKKMEIKWSHVLSISVNHGTETLEVELSKPPTFHMEINPQAGKRTNWEETDQDFTSNQASLCRRHTLHFTPEDLKEFEEKLTSGDSFWSKLIEIRFPTLPESPYFEQYGNGNNHGQSQGRVQVEEGSSFQLLATQSIPPSSQLRNTRVLGTQAYLMTGYGNSNNNNSNSQDNRSEVLGTQQLNEPCDLPVNQGITEGKLDVASTNEQTLNNDSTR